MARHSKSGGTWDMLRRNLESGVPARVARMDPGGHRGMVTGDDTRGTEPLRDDLNIFADSGDSHDDRNDGVTSFNFKEFDAHYSPQNMKDRAWVVAVPGTATLTA